MALSREYRITKKTDFKKVFSEGKTVRGSFFFIVYSKSSLENNRFGVVVSSKVAKVAVDRNKIKRQVREILRETINITPKSFDIIAVARPIAKGKSFDKLRADLQKIIKKIK